MCAYAIRRLALSRGIALQFYRGIHIERIAEHNLLGKRVDVERAVFLNYHVELTAVIATVDTQPLEHIGIIFRKVEAEYAPSVGIVKKCPQGPAIGIRPCLHRQEVGHLRPIHASYGAYEFVGHGAYRRKIVFHGKIHVACADKMAGAATPRVAILHGAHGGILRSERSASACAEIAEHASLRDEPRSFIPRAAVIPFIVKRLRHTGHHVVQLRDDGKHLYLKQYGVAPAPLELHRKVSIPVLRHSDPSRIVAEPFQKTVEPRRYVAAPAAHEVNLAVGYHDIFEHLNLTRKLRGKSGRIYRIVAVIKPVFHLCAGIILDNGAAHGELIQVVVGKMSYYLMHSRRFLIINITLQHSLRLIHESCRYNFSTG